MIKIYLFGCKCGKNSRLVTDAQRHGNTVLYNTKRDSQRLKEHIYYLTQAGIDIKHYPAIVVDDNDQRITLLELWKPQA